MQVKRDEFETGLRWTNEEKKGEMKKHGGGNKDREVRSGETPKEGL